jgi:excisionase family DNA binding protein
MEKATYTVHEAAVLADCSDDTMYEAVKRGQIPSIKIGKKGIRIPKAAYDRILDEGNSKEVGGGE